MVRHELDLLRAWPGDGVILYEVGLRLTFDMVLQWWPVVPGCGQVFAKQVFGRFVQTFFWLMLEAGPERSEKVGFFV